MRKDELKKLKTMNAWEAGNFLSDKLDDVREIYDHLNENVAPSDCYIVLGRIMAYQQLLATEVMLMNRMITDYNIKQAEKEKI